MISINLPQSIGQRLERLARRTGRTKNFHAREAILNYLTDLKDIYLAEASLKRICEGKERTIPLGVVLKRYRLKRGTPEVKLLNMR